MVEGARPFSNPTLKILRIGPLPGLLGEYGPPLSGYSGGCLHGEDPHPVVREPEQAPGQVAQGLRPGFGHPPLAAGARGPRGCEGPPEGRGLLGGFRPGAGRPRSPHAGHVLLGHPWGAELDLLVLHSGRRYGFEFKLADAPGTSRSMRIALSDLGLERLRVVYPGETAYELDEAISVLPLKAVPELCRTLRGQVPG